MDRQEIKRTEKESFLSSLGFSVNKSTRLWASVNNQRYLEMFGDISDCNRDLWGLPGI